VEKLSHRYKRASLQQVYGTKAIAYGKKLEEELKAAHALREQ